MSPASTIFPCAIPFHCSQIFDSQLKCDLHSLLALQNQLALRVLSSPSSAVTEPVSDDLPDYQDFLDACYGDQDEEDREEDKEEDKECEPDEKMMDVLENNSWDSAGEWETSDANIGAYFDIEASITPPSSVALAWEWVPDCDYRDCFDVEDVPTGLSHPPKPLNATVKKTPAYENQQMEMHRVLQELEERGWM